MSDSEVRVEEARYEMLWDCAYCGTKKLLGKTHKHCPECGASQDVNNRYFPPEDEKVPVHENEYYGVDWVCASCDTGNSKNSKFCGNCGASPDGAKDASLISSGEETPKKKSSSKKIWIILFVVALLLVALFFYMCRTKSESMEVTGHSWVFSIDIERKQDKVSGDWCSKLPVTKKVLKRYSKKRTTNEKVKVGENCTKKKVDKGDGTFVVRKECKPIMKDKKVDDEWCEYKIKVWTKVRAEKNSGKDMNPSFPVVTLKQCNALLCER